MLLLNYQRWVKSLWSQSVRPSDTSLDPNISSVLWDTSLSQWRAALLRPTSADCWLRVSFHRGLRVRGIFVRPIVCRDPWPLTSLRLLSARLTSRTRVAVSPEQTKNRNGFYRAEDVHLDTHWEVFTAEGKAWREVVFTITFSRFNSVMVQIIYRYGAVISHLLWRTVTSTSCPVK